MSPASTIVAEGIEGRWTDYAGGYSDMVAQRGGGLAPKPPARAKPARTGGQDADPVAAPQRKRLSYKDEYALKMLPERIAARTSEIERLEAILADPALYRRDPKRFDDTGKALASAREDLSGLEDEWLRLEMLRDEAG